MSEIESQADFGQADVSAHLTRAEWFVAAGRFSDAEASYLEAVASGSPRARSEYASFLFRMDRFSEAEALLRALLETAVQTADTRLQIVVTHNLAAVHRVAGNRLTAAEFQQKSIAAELRGANAAVSDLSASTLSSLANDALMAGKYNLARKLFRRSLSLETAAGSLAGQAADWGSLGIVALFQGRHKPAVSCLLRAYVRHRQLGDAYGMGCDLLNIAEAARRLGRTNASIRFLQRARSKFESVDAARQSQKANLLREQIARVAQVAGRDPLWN